MEKYLQVLSILCVIIFFASVLEAQAKADVAIDMMVLKVNSERVERLTATRSSANTAVELLQGVLTDSFAKVLQSPQVRAADAQKVTFRIGAKSPRLSKQFPFVDIGLNFELTLHVRGQHEATLRVSIEGPAVEDMVSVARLDQHVPAQRRNEADIRLRDGQISILGEFHEANNSNMALAIPGVVNIPALGEAVLGDGQSEKYRQGLVIVMVPRMVQTPAIVR